MAKSNLRVGDFVLIMCKLCPPTRWPIARVPKVHPGADGLVRAATLRTDSLIFDRPIEKLILLPILDHDVSANMLRRAEERALSSCPISPVQRDHRAQSTSLQSVRIAIFCKATSCLVFRVLRLIY